MEFLGRQGGSLARMVSLIALISSALWGSADFEGGRLSKKHVPIAVLGFSQVIGLLFGIIVIAVSSGWHAPTLTAHGYFISGIGAGLSGYVGLVCLYTGLASGSMGVVSPISAMGAVIPLAYSLLHGASLSLITSIGIALALVGAFCASGPELSNGLPLRPLLLALCAALSFGVAMTFISIGSKSNPLMTMVTMRVATLVVTIAIAIRARSLGGFVGNEYPSLIFIGVADFSANLLLGIACARGSVPVAMVLGSMYPIATAIFAFKLLHERLHTIQYVGVVLAVSGVALISAF